MSLTIQTPDGNFQCYVARPSQPGTYPVLVVLQEIFGVNAGIRSIADDYAAKGFIAVCPDLFWRAEAGLSMSESSEGDWAKGFALYSSYDFDKGVQDIIATVTAARKIDAGGGTVGNGKVGVTGYCLGGLLTYLTAARSSADAFVAYYGGGTEKYVAEAAKIKDPMIYHLAEEDEYINKEAQAAIKTSLANKPNVTVYSYPGRNHAFARPGGSHFDAAYAALANGRTDAFFKQQLAL
jgi:carboxymethylenebutenolidase